MSQPAKPIIKPINFEDTAKLVAEFAADRNIPTKQYPAEEKKREGEGGVAAVPIPVRPKVSRSPTRKFTLDMPDYVIDAINLKAVETKSTSRHIVLRGLRAIGFTIRDEDMPADGRRS